MQNADMLRRGFRYMNKYFMVPMFRMGLGPLIGNPLSGYMMVIKSVGHKTGLTRYTPVNYTIIDGAIYFIAGFGETSHWYRNVKAQPEIEVILPDGAIFGVVEEVEEPNERLRALRQVLQNAGFAGFLAGLNPFSAMDEALLEKTAGLPVMRIRPLGVGSGPADPGGWLWITLSAVGALWLLEGLLQRRRRTD